MAASQKAITLARDVYRLTSEVGQLIKLDPRKNDDPIVWSLPVPAGIGDHRGGGIWSTPALHGDVEREAPLVHAVALGDHAL